jgi:hypothetical protein
MPRPQFSIRTLLWLTLVIGAGCALGRPLVRNYAPKWGEPEERITAYSDGWNGFEIESSWPTGRVERKEFFWCDRDDPSIHRLD